MFASNVTHTNRRGIYLLTALTLLFTPLLSASNGNVRAAPAYTEVGGPIISDTTWTLANSPYIIVANVEVWQGVTLTIQPGVVVKFNKDKLLQVDGALIARGAAASPITFTSNQASPAKGDWKNIEFTDSSADATFDGAGNYIGGSILQYCIVEDGGSGANGAIQTDKASPLIDHCTVRDNSSGGIRAIATSGSPIVIRNNTISGNSALGGGGIFADYSTVTGNTVNYNTASNGGGGGIFVYNSTVTGNTVSGNSAIRHADDDYCVGGGIDAENSTVTGNTVSGNSSNRHGGGICVSYSTVMDNTISGNSASYGEGGGIYAGHSMVTGNTVTGNSAAYSLGGGIYASYSTVSGNAVSGNSAAYGGGICAENDLVHLG